MRKKYRFLVLLAAIVAVLALMPDHALGLFQQKKTFSTDPMEFTAELSEEFMKAEDEDSALAVVNKLKSFMSGSSEDMRDMFMATCNAQLRRRGRAYPDFLKTLNSFITLDASSRLTGSDRKVWMGVMQSTLKGSLQAIRRFIDFSVAYAERGAIYLARGVEWRAAAKCSLIDDKGDLRIEVPMTTLSCFGQRDSIEVLNTKGSVSYKTGLWKGDCGKVTWERTGWDPNEVYARFDEYTIKMNTGAFSVDSVVFVNKKYFPDTELTGRLFHKCAHRSSGEGMRTPRFETPKGTRWQIENVFDGMDYDGGFTQAGASVIGTGDPFEPATLTLLRNDSVRATFESTAFLFSPNGCNSRRASVNIPLDDEAITHPGVGFAYSKDSLGQWKVDLMRGKSGIEQAKFRDSYHNMNIEADVLQWYVSGDNVTISSAEGSPVGYAYFESVSYYSEEMFRKAWGRNSIHPFYQIADFYRYNGGSDSRGFNIIDYAAFVNADSTQAASMMVELARDGFVDYNVDQGIVAPQQRLFDFMDFAADKKDYDEMMFVSVDSSYAMGQKGRLPNGVINIAERTISVRKVEGVQLSTYGENKQGAYLWPDKSKGGNVVLGRNRNIEYDGVINVGLVTIEGSDFNFDYDEFTITMDSVQDMTVGFVDSTQIGRDGRYARKKIQNSLTELSGVFYLNDPANKSGRNIEMGVGYPRMNSTTPAKIYYDKNILWPNNMARSSEHNYKPERFYFLVDTFSLDASGAVGRDNTPFTGVLHAGGIIPDLRHELVVRQDNSFGFVTEDASQVYPLYGGKATFTGKLDLSNNGFCGVGKVEYSNSTAESYSYINDENKQSSNRRDDKFLLLLDQMEGTTRQFNVRASSQAPKFPGVELGENQRSRDQNNLDVPGQAWLTFYPKDDKLHVRNLAGRGRFQMFPTTKKSKGFECELDGSLVVTPKQLFGSGHHSIYPANDSILATSEVESLMFRYTDKTASADSSYCYFTSSEQASGISDVGTGMLRRHLFSRKEVKDRAEFRELREKVRKGLTFDATMNNSIKEDTLINRIRVRDERFAKELDKYSQSTVLNFETQEGKFSYLTSEGVDTRFEGVDFETKMKNYTWLLMRNELVIGQEHGQPNRFYSTNNKDTLELFAPLARFDNSGLALTCEGVKDILVADAKVILKENDNVVVRKHAALDKLTDVRVDVKTDSTSHQFEHAAVTIKNRNEYDGNGRYTYLDNEGGRHLIRNMTLKAVDDDEEEEGVTIDKVTIAVGPTDGDINIDKNFAFSGTLKITGNRRHLWYDGGAKMRHRSATGSNNYIKFEARINPSQVRIPVTKTSYGTIVKSDKAQDRIYHTVQMGRDSAKLTSAMLEYNKFAADGSGVNMVDINGGDLYYNGIFNRFEIKSKEKIVKPDTTGTFFYFSPQDETLGAVGRINMGFFMSRTKFANNDFLTVNSAGTLTHNRKSNTFKVNLYSEWDFFMKPEVTTYIWKDVLASNAPVCDSMSYRREMAMQELHDTATISHILQMAYAQPDEKTGMLLTKDGPAFVFDGLDMTWSDAKKSWVCDTMVNLISMRHRKVFRKVKIQSEVFMKRNSSVLRMLMRFDSEKWYYIELSKPQKTALVRLWSYSDEFNALVGDKLESDRGYRSKTVACKDSQRKDMFLQGFGLDNIGVDPNTIVDDTEQIDGDDSDMISEGDEEEEVAEETSADEESAAEGSEGESQETDEQEQQGSDDSQDTEAVEPSEDAEAPREDE